MLLPQSCCRAAGMPLVSVCIGLHYSTSNVAARLHLSVSLQAPPNEPVVGLLEGGYIAYVIVHIFSRRMHPPGSTPMSPAAGFSYYRMVKTRLPYG